MTAQYSICFNFHKNTHIPTLTIVKLQLCIQNSWYFGEYLSTYMQTHNPIFVDECCHFHDKVKIFSDNPRINTAFSKIKTTETLRVIVI